MNSLEVNLFLNELELICLHPIKWFQILLSITNCFICILFCMIDFFFFLFHENGRPHLDSVTLQMFTDLGYDTMPHPPYYPD